MKLALVFLALVAIAAPAAADAPKLEVTAKVVELPKKTIACGRIAVYAVARFEVTSVDKGTLPGKELLAVVVCPEMLKLGATVKLTLRPVTKNESFSDDFKARPGPRWFATRR